jgi:hypothetical protein
MIGVLRIVHSSVAATRSAVLLALFALAVTLAVLILGRDAV